MKNIYLIISLAVSVNCCMAQLAPDSSQFAGTNRKTIFAEALGNGIGISLNFDKRLIPGRNNGLGVRVGFGMLPTYLTFPFAMNYIIGKRRSGFETSAGITPMYNFDRFSSHQRFDAIMLLNIGYRLQPLYNGLMFRINWSAARNIAGNDPGRVYIETAKDQSILWPGFSIGYSFNNTPKVPDMRKSYAPPVTLNGKYRKVVFAEVLGNGIGFSVNSDMRLNPDRNDGLGFRAGIGLIPNYDRAITLPLEINYILGKRKSGLEAGIGITSLYSIEPNTNFFYDPEYGDPYSKVTAIGVFNLGYRYQATKGFMLRAYYTAFYDGLYYSKLFYKDGVVYVAYPGLSIGYSFNRK